MTHYLLKPRPGTLDHLAQVTGAQGDWQLAENLGITFDELQAVRYGQAALSFRAAHTAWRMMGAPASFWTWFDKAPEEGVKTNAA